MSKPTVEQWHSAWAEAEKIATKQSPKPTLPAIAVGVCVAFCSGMFAMVVLTLAGLDIDHDRAASRTLGLAIIFCGVAGYLIARLLEKAHSKAFTEAFDEIIRPYDTEKARQNNPE